MYGVLHSEAHVFVCCDSAKEQVLALQYYTQTPLTWPSIHHIKNKAPSSPPLSPQGWMIGFHSLPPGGVGGGCLGGQRGAPLFFMANGHIFYRKVFWGQLKFTGGTRIMTKTIIHPL